MQDRQLWVQFKFMADRGKGAAAVIGRDQGHGPMEGGLKLLHEKRVKL